jgi:hypothetical protein
MYDLFARRRIPEKHTVRRVHFTTPNPGVTSTCQWLAVEAQVSALLPSSVDLLADPWLRRFKGTTRNVSRLRLDLAALQPAEWFKVELDGQALDKVAWPAGGQVWFQNTDGKWSVAPGPRPPGYKGPHRNGPFKDAFRHRMILVYGTRGTPEENAWAAAKARFDAESFYYRGNGSVEVVPDTGFNPARERDRAVILYGNADSNLAWGPLLGSSPIQVKRGGIKVGDKSLEGAAFGCLFLQPRPGSDSACVAVVAGTGLAGMRVTDKQAYLSPAIGFPDFTVLSPAVYDAGSKGVVCAGFFGPDWTMAGAETVWQEATPVARNE